MEGNSYPFPSFECLNNEGGTTVDTIPLFECFKNLKGNERRVERLYKLTIMSHI